ncbi:tRNA lysidine(34) synthetase TilS [Leuconostoc mesenteroides]|uniref:tRNA lysidine(34) synthetase TilS n=1 Tax=Leuconostoc mesenteroides TaxID=1245 RepID=UPI00038B2DF6|nr:tRNA lysidine(34) synthetase TilS [Leuconostoc mesenteroides]EQC84031.1 tRNA(Ile)-lysidine synthetase [Leuconostoc mesenteroides subsp. cremoris TIFN8]MBS0942526.1 tRNA lysidine(34) synthetase TilS [Leuconostoc mesenteroides]ORI39164.1 tRNA lysidine(34) synthetase TilS [Leuconostoc mesenteroides subsp. cremoris]ORI39836.1 tRNA lysidine(34) synthetase TilS [Leuconostoc mesenteroides subsp. cremoris]ORI41995.1 tRNA lysidine(34) synthetase TilS [Leuconostoc mesenteroides subsp. cremoris]
MTEKILQTIKQYNWPETVIVAVSGGVDSVVLVHALSKTKANLVIAHVNYRLREESDDDADFVRQLATQTGAIFEEQVWQHIPDHAVEKAARQFRYDFFEELAQKYHTNTIAVAHHADDQAETVLLKMIRGGRLQQMGGMQTKNHKVIRPFLSITKQELITYAQDNQLGWRQDKTNFDVDYTPRNLLRNDVLPKLTTINQRAVRHINNMAAQILQQQRLIDNQAKIYANDIQDWQKIPTLWQLPTLKYWLQKNKLFNIKENQLQQMIQLLSNTHKPNGKIALADNFEFIKTYQKISIQKQQNMAQVLTPVMLKLNQWHSFAKTTFMWTDNVPMNGQSFIKFQLTRSLPYLSLRPAKASDKIALINGHKNLRRLAIDEKLTPQERTMMWVLATADDEVIAVHLRSNQWRVNADFAVKENTQPYWLVCQIEET